ncbi:MAG TPA: zinc-dependent metalloprotease, partial [Dermatophilaceae bacterium]|nr:zinc-dependent metalloprotease [Dermatophilaceae bacterium]
RAGRDYVLRRTAASPRGDGNVTNRREARVLAALAGTDAPHPRLIAACSETDVIGGAFYLMEPVDGFNAVWTSPETLPTPDEIAAPGLWVGRVHG